MWGDNWRRSASNVPRSRCYQLDCNGKLPIFIRVTTVHVRFRMDRERVPGIALIKANYPHASILLLFDVQAAAGAVLGVFKPVRQPPFPTPDRVIDSVSALKVNVLFAIPVFLEASLHYGASFLIPAIFLRETLDLIIGMGAEPSSCGAIEAMQSCGKSHT